MFKIIFHRLPVLLVLVGLGISGAVNAVENMGQPYVEASQYQRVQDLDIYYGVMPAQIAGSFPEPALHGGAPAARGNEYHFVVALFDHSGKRVTDARVTARVRELGMDGTQKRLEPMRIGDVTTFGNYFALRQGGIYRLEIEIVRAKSAKVEATFEYRLP
ncbi:MAG TPA: hypothetical protein VIU93_07385 [Gallionellaceae bacterium]